MNIRTTKNMLTLTVCFGLIGWVVLPRPFSIIWFFLIGVTAFVEFLHMRIEQAEDVQNRIIESASLRHKLRLLTAEDRYYIDCREREVDELIEYLINDKEADDDFLAS